MKKTSIILVILSILLASFSAGAIPANRKPIKVRQPDGSYITIKLVGDEFSHKTLMDGVECHKDANGFWVKGPKESNADLTKAGFPSGPKMTRQNSQPRMSYDDIRTGRKKFLVLLIEFKDLKMTYGKEQFHNMLNLRGYDEFGGTGSAAEYFEDNSLGKFTPEFDVVGPITLDNSYAYYGKDKEDKEGTDEKAYEALVDACNIAHSLQLVKFSDYDHDGDGVVESIFFYYAGYSQAEGGGDDTIWPHAWYLRSGAGVDLKIDGKYIDSYACAAELTGYSGKNITGIGAFCHEFSHVIGLPDLYDTDYEESGGQGEAVYDWSLMCSGSYLNNGRTPPYYMGIERELLNWGKPTVLSVAGPVKIEPVHTNKYCSTMTDTDGEVFNYEYRDGTKWDKYLPKGLIVYHIDASTRMVNGMTAKSRWASGHNLNVDPSHQLCYIVPSKSKPEFYEDIPFPGSGNVRSFEGIGWSGQRTGYILENIKIDDNCVSANLSTDISKKLSGTVYSADGKPIEGAAVSLTVSESSKSPAAKFIRKSLRASKGKYYAETSADGVFSINLDNVTEVDFTVTVNCRGYIGQSSEVKISNGATFKDFTLNSINYSGLSRYSRFKFKQSTIEEAVYVLEWTNVQEEFSVGVGFKASELTDLVGARIDSILFACPVMEPSGAKITIDAGTKNKPIFEKEVPMKQYVGNGWTHVGLVEDNITVPDGKDLIFGYNITGAKETKFALLSTDKMPGGMYYTYGKYDWSEYTDGCALIIVKFTKTESSVSSAGINVIAVPSALKAGDTLPLSLIECESAKPASVSWKYDGAAASGSVSLSAGEHLIEAVLSFADGTEETIERWIKVN